MPELAGMEEGSASSSEHTVPSGMSATGTALSRRNKKGDKCNLRKSLAWNQAFLTDEGVLNPVELSLLSGSAGESSGSALNGTVGGILPLFTDNNCSSRPRPPLHELAENMADKAARIQAKDTRASGVVSKSGFLNHELPHADAAPGKIPLAKGIPRSMPPSPATTSQKRAASTSTAIPVSKIPKYMPAKSHVSSHLMTPRNSMLTAKSTKPFQTENTVGLDQSIGARSASAIDKKDLIYSSSSTKPFDNAHEKNIVTLVEKNTTSLKAVKDPPHPSKPHQPIISSGLSKTVSTIPRCASRVTGNPTTAVLAKPSALRMPSPSLGFFCQGKVSPSYTSQPQKHIQSSESNFPSSEKPIYQKSLHELRPSSMHAVQQTIKGTAATSFDAGDVISESVKILCVKEKIEIDQLNARDKEGCITSESRGFQIDGKKQLKVGSLSVGGNIEERSSELNNNKESDTSFSQTGDMSLGEISNFIEKIPQSNVSEEIPAADPSIGGFKGSGISASNFPSAGGRVLEKIEEGNFAEDNVFSQVGNVGHDTCIVLNKGKLAAQNSCYDYDLRPDIVAKNTDLSVSTESELFFRSSKDQIIGYGSSARQSLHRSDLEQLQEDSSEGEKQTTQLHASNAGDRTSAVQNIDKLVAQVSYCIPNLGSASTAQNNDSVASSDVESFFTSSKEQITDLVSCANLSSQQRNGSGSPQESNLGAILNKHRHISETEGDGTYFVLEEDKLEAQASYSIPDIGSGLTAANIDLGTSVEAGSFKSSKEQFVGICTASLEYIESLNPEAISIAQGSILQTASTTHELSSILPEESQPSLYQDKDLQICRNQSNSDSDISLTKEDDALKPDLILLKNKVNAPPFSDEWLAAVEAFGEDILQLKSGPVQNSPREKDLPEPGPWSPVKRKAQDIGPFDCTKYLKNPPASDTQ